MDYIINTPEQEQEMLAACGKNSIDQLFADILPHLRPKSFNLQEGKTEIEILSQFKNIAQKNFTDLICFLGGGCYDHFIPSVVDALASRSEFYTAYTPYQAELSQGILQAIYEYQSQICRLTGMEVCNASMYDGGSALFEAMMMACSGKATKRVIVDSTVNPLYREILKTCGNFQNIEIVEIPHKNLATDHQAIKEAMTPNTAAVILQNPNYFGIIDNYSDITEYAQSIKALSILSAYPTPLAKICTPAEQNFDIVCGEAQPLGIPLSFGGPFIGYLATRTSLVRKMPGRIVGKTVDIHGKDAYILTLQAREQHIRREKATSNICSNQALCALKVHIYLSFVGKEGLKEIAQDCLNKTHYAKTQLSQIAGIEIPDQATHFNEFVIRLPEKNIDTITKKLLNQKILAGIPLKNYYPELSDCLLIAITEKRTIQEIDQLVNAMKGAL